MKKFSLVLVLLFTFTINVHAAVDSSKNEIFKINGKTIYSTTTLDGLSSLLGSPKLVTMSAFGGNTYSYYPTDYSWYFQVETDSNGKIQAYGGLGENFAGKNYSYHDPKSNRYSFLKGIALEDSDDLVYGEYDYMQTSYSAVQNYWHNYEKMEELYTYDLQKTSILVSKVIAKMFNKDFPQEVISEEIYYKNVNLKKNNSDLYNYARDNQKTSELSLVHASYSSEFYECLPNPLLLAGDTRRFSMPSEFKYFLYDINIKDYGNYYSTVRYDTTKMFVNPSFLIERKGVSYTEDELNKLALAKEQYNLYTTHGEQYTASGANFWDETAVWDNLPLKAGKINSQVLTFVTDYLNVARVGLGLNPYIIDFTMSNAAQHKAVLSYYLQTHGYDGGHDPEKIPEIDQSFYDIAQSHMSGENLFTGNVQNSIIFALNDGYSGDPSCGHRYNLLDPYFTNIGLGQAGEGLSFQIQGAHKFEGYQRNDTELVAWPSNGIFPMDLAYNGIGYWTAKFYKSNYDVSSLTSVVVKNLSTDATYEIKKGSLSADQRLITYGKTEVSFLDENIAYQSGDVFEITLKNIKKDGKTEDYSYRSVFYSFYQNSEGNTATGITLDKKKITLFKGETTTLNAIVNPSEAKNKLLDFSSSVSEVASVRQDGFITALTPGKTTIVVKSENGLIETAEVTVLDATLEKSVINLSVGTSEQIKIKILPDGETASDITYSYKSNNTPVASVDGSGLVTANSNGEATITITSNKGHTWECKVIVSDYIKGDLNIDKKVDMLDAYMALRIALMLNDPTNLQLTIGDMDNTNKIDMLDTYIILRTALKIS